MKKIIFVLLCTVSAQMQSMQSYDYSSSGVLAASQVALLEKYEKQQKAAKAQAEKHPQNTQSQPSMLELQQESMKACSELKEQREAAREAYKQSKAKNQTNNHNALWYPVAGGLIACAIYGIYNW